MPLPELIEPVAVVLALAYLGLAARENLWCWACAFVSSALFVWVLWIQDLPMEAFLNAFYALMAIAGWYEWRFGGRDHGELGIRAWDWRRHVLVLAAILLATLLTYWLSRSFFQSASPWLDSFIAGSSLVVTFLVILKILENWLYWIVIDAVAAGLYFERGLHYFALLFVLYVLIAVFGYLHWRRRYLSATI